MSIALADHVSFTPGEDGGSVLLDQRNGRYWQLSTTGTVILRLLLREEHAQDVVQVLAEQHPKAAERIPADVDSFLRALRERGLVTA